MLVIKCIPSSKFEFLNVQENHIRSTFLMQNDSDYQVQAAIQHLQQVFDESKKQRNEQLKIWQDRVESLEQQLAMAQSNIQKLEADKAKVEADLNSAIVQNENLKSQNQALMQALQEKEEHLNRFVNLNQNLKNLIDQTTYTPTEMKLPQFTSDALTTKQSSYSVQTKATTTAINTTTQQSRQYTQQEPMSPIKPTPKPQPTSSRRTASKSSLFIKAAKEELSPSDFNHMISEINLYNKKSQSREETIANVKRLLGSAHRSLFDQFLPMVSGV